MKHSINAALQRQRSRPVDSPAIRRKVAERRLYSLIYYRRRLNRIHEEMISAVAEMAWQAPLPLQPPLNAGPDYFRLRR